MPTYEFKAQIYRLVLVETLTGTVNADTPLAAQDEAQQGLSIILDDDQISKIIELDFCVEKPEAPVADVPDPVFRRGAINYNPVSVARNRNEPEAPDDENDTESTEYRGLAHQRAHTVDPNKDDDSAWNNFWDDWDIYEPPDYYEDDDDTDEVEASHRGLSDIRRNRG